MIKNVQNKPNFLVVGTQKAGTTAMYSVLRQHSQIFLPETKEIHYFDKKFEKGFDWYIENFNGARPKHIAIGEITPNYMYDENVPQRIFSNLGENIKLIFIFRNPADRAFSNYKMNIQRNNETNTFKKAIELDLQRIKNNEQYPVVFHYIKRGFYDEQVTRFLKYFDKKNILFLLFKKDLIDNRRKTFKLIYEFLGINDENIPVNVKITPNVTHRSSKIEKILNTSNGINKFAKKIIPDKVFRTNIKYFLTKINQKPTAKISELNEIKPYLINEIYRNSILNMQNLINADLSNWLKY